MILFIGTTLDTACIFLTKGVIKSTIQKTFLSFASGVMVAVSAWSFLTPAMETSEDMGRLAFIPAAVGLLAEIGLLLLMDEIIPHFHPSHEEPEGTKSSLSKITVLVLVITLHSTPEGITVDVVLAGMLTGDGSIMTAGAFVPTIGIAIQNFPEGAIIFIPLKSEGKSKGKVFLLGTLSGTVEPIGVVVTILLVSCIMPILSYLLSLAIGAVLYVVVEELIPEASGGEHTNIGALGFAVGSVIMMVLDVALG